MLKIHLCKGDETLEEALQKINETAEDNIVYTFNKDEDRCYIGDEKFANAPYLINYKNTYYALRISE